MLALAKPKTDLKPVIVFEHYTNTDFSEMNVIQIFDSMIVTIKILENTSEIKVPDLNDDYVSYFPLDIFYMRRKYV